jgi:protein-S-isoprenylcysteine O-methyltransferase Ste14
MRRPVRWLVFTAAIAAALFGLAGTWRDPWLWAYLIVFSLGIMIGLLSIDDDLSRERFSPPSEGADRLPLRAIRLVGVAHFVVGALDTGRFHWTTVSDPLRLVGLAGFALGLILIMVAMAANRFFSPVVRIQSERGHHVIDRGPYGLIRHPGYLGMIVAIPCSGLALGSWLSVALGLVYSALIVRRVMFEDRFLHTNLVGYSEYAARVRYRLMPGAW